MTDSSEVSYTPQDIDRSQIERSQLLTGEQRVLEGFELSEFAMKVVESGVRHQHPEADDATILRIMSERIARIKRLEERSRGK